MTDATSLQQILITWAPMIMLISIWIYFMRSSLRSKSGMTQIQYLEELLKEEKRHNAQIEKLQERTNLHLERVVNKTVSRSSDGR